MILKSQRNTVMTLFQVIQSRKKQLKLSALLIRVQIIRFFAFYNKLDGPPGVALARVCGV